MNDAAQELRKLADDLDWFRFNRSESIDKIRQAADHIEALECLLLQAQAAAMALVKKKNDD